MSNKNANIVILHASQQPFLSIGVHFGGMTLNGHKYKYISEHDAYVRHDYVNKIKKHKSWSDFLEYVRKQDPNTKTDKDDTPRNT
jgi:hypothetical protein